MQRQLSQLPTLYCGWMDVEVWTQMTLEKALDAWKQMLSEIDKENWLFVGTINPEMVQIAIDAIEKEIGMEECYELD